MTERLLIIKRLRTIFMKGENRKMKKLILAVMILNLIGPAVINTYGADENVQIKFQALSQVEVITKNKKDKDEVKLVDADKAKVVPGTVVIFTNNYTNMTKESVSDIVITNPVPTHVVYVTQSARGEGTDIDFSVDQGKSFDKPNKLFVKNKKGKKVKATEVDYTHIRWTVRRNIDSGKGGFVSFKGKIK